MKRLFSFLFLCVFAVTASLAQKTYVLSAGVSNYGMGSGNLVATDDDAKDIYKIFKKRPKTTAGIITSKYVTSENLEKRLKAIVQVAKPEDTIIFFFSGHGDSEGYLCLYGGELYSYIRLCNLLNKANTKNIFCFVDACFSGSSASVATQTGQDNKVTFLVSSRASETSRENPNVMRGLFAYALKKGMRGYADTNSDKRITMRELYDYVYKDVTGRMVKKGDNPQHPQFIGNDSMLDKVVIDWKAK